MTDNTSEDSLLSFAATGPFLKHLSTYFLYVVGYFKALIVLGNYGQRKIKVCCNAAHCKPSFH